MSIVLRLAVIMSSSRAAGGAASGLRRLMPNKSIGLNILAVAAGVAFLTFALAIYDGYRNKVETMIFALTPHITLRPIAGFAKDEAEPDERARCEKVCRTPNAVYIEDAKVADEDARRFEAGRMKALENWMKSDSAKGASLSRVLFEEVRLDLSVGKFRTGGERPMRVLGVERIAGEMPSPRVDLTFPDATVAQRFYKGEGVLIPDFLAGEIVKEAGERLEPGVTKLRVAGKGPPRDITIIGVHNIGILGISQNLIIAPYAIAAEILGEKPDTPPTYVGVAVADPATAQDMAMAARGELRRSQISASPWQQTAVKLYDQLALYRRIIFVTLCLAILVTMINTFVNINILIMERAQNIGIMRAMGLGPGKLMLVFVVIGLLQSLAGTVIGYIIGIVTGHLLNDHINSMVRDFLPITDTRIVVDPKVFAAQFAFISFVSIIACLLAARRVLKSAIIANLRSL